MRDLRIYPPSQFTGFRVFADPLPVATPRLTTHEHCAATTAFEDLKGITPGKVTVAAWVRVAGPNMRRPFAATFRAFGLQRRHRLLGRRRCRRQGFALDR